MAESGHALLSEAVLARYSRRLQEAYAEAMAAPYLSQHLDARRCVESCSRSTQTPTSLPCLHVATQTCTSMNPAVGKAQPRLRIPGVQSSQAGVIDLIVQQSVAEYTPARCAETEAKVAAELQRNMAIVWP